ncbi:MAG TPA: enoyl-CoA hydratase-related protein [Candidatus Obscuribacterales bacterium]
MVYTCFTLETDGPTAHLKLNRPEKLNSMIPEFWAELPEAVGAVEKMSAARVLVISSTGKHFSAGMDLSVFQTEDLIATDTAAERECLRRLILVLQETFNRLERCRVPVIAAIQGGCIGAALDMAAACDIRYCTESAYFVIQEINLAMMADLGSLQRLPRLIPEGIVRELAFTGDKLDARRAQQLGLVNSVFKSQPEMLEAAIALAKRISERAPLAVSASKEALNYLRDHGVADGLHYAASLQAAIFDRAQVVESYNAQKEKRAPQFANLAPARTSLVTAKQDE